MYSQCFNLAVLALKHQLHFFFYLLKWCSPRKIFLRKLIVISAFWILKWSDIGFADWVIGLNVRGQSGRRRISWNFWVLVMMKFIVNLQFVSWLFLLIWCLIVEELIGSVTMLINLKHLKILRRLRLMSKISIHIFLMLIKYKLYFTIYSSLYANKSYSFYLP